MSGTAGPPRPRAARDRRLVLALWAGLAVVLWNGVYDIGISLGVRDYLAQAALAEMGRRAEVPLDGAMARTVREAALRATFWTALTLSVAGVSGWLLTRRP